MKIGNAGKRLSIITYVTIVTLFSKLPYCRSKISYYIYQNIYSISNRSQMKESRILYPSPLLSQYIKYYWVLKTDEIEPVTVQTIPSGCVHLVFHRGDNLNIQSKGIQPKNFIRGQFSTYGSLISKGNIDMIAVIFHPLGLNPFIQCSMSEFYNHYIDVEDLEDIELNYLKQTITSEEDIETCIQLIETFFIKRMIDIDCNYKRIQHSIRQIIRNPQIKVNTLSESACLGYRQFKRVFTNYVGMSSKEYYRVVRFQRILYLLQHHPEMEITDLSYSCGFYDSSHLVKDFREFSGCSPTHYLSSRSPYSTFFSEDCRLNIIKFH